MNFISELWKQAVRDIGYCVRCGRVFEPPEAPDVCHANEGKSMGAKNPDSLTFPGCRTCHSEIDSGKDLVREDRRNIVNACIVKTIRLLTERGFFDCFADASPKQQPSRLRRRTRQNSTRTPEKVVKRIGDAV